jgi:hypothetical protein
LAAFGEAISALILRHSVDLEKNGGTRLPPQMLTGSLRERTIDKPKSAIGGWNTGVFVSHLQPV